MFSVHISQKKAKILYVRPFFNKQQGGGIGYSRFHKPLFLASPDALEVIVVTESLSVSTDLTDVTLVSDDTY